MKKHAASPDELDLFQLAEVSRELVEQRKSLEDRRKRAEQERIEREWTLPPSDVVDASRAQKSHNEAVSWNEIHNVRREQGKSLFMLVLLIVMTATLIWWGLRLM